jgi:hypothetical protein
MKHAALTFPLLAGLAALATLAAPPARADEAKPKVVFQDSLKGKLGKGWTWVRENPKTWKSSPQGLEIQVEPGVAPTVKNALVRKSPARDKGKHAYEVTVEFLAEPTQQFEQGGITWYVDDKPVFKLVHELIDGKTYIIPSKKPTKTRVMQLRLVVDGDMYEAFYRPDGKGEFQSAGTGKLAGGGEDKVSIQCYNGPKEGEHIVRFSDFRILELPAKKK